ncbi:uncharacterized protein SCHCODRAFT_02641885 [Schizophyllum commune H4-8]|uniref:uncharacterized protein n=1 Tax=Schizophyllum commune (strain H4-8 / FGSC 9210) TaxID=578458 RepID=UPI00215EC395|nr:uncharacterized protein SCHCODRAFT_02641885 [Schizophyllum commune H4-8]KAI5886488.1 hypothetical protein SCHCODRAFT_02641885 [Schizophyllum commune H4-8]
MESSIARRADRAEREGKGRGKEKRTGTRSLSRTENINTDAVDSKANDNSLQRHAESVRRGADRPQVADKRRNSKGGYVSHSPAVQSRDGFTNQASSRGNRSRQARTPKHHHQAPTRLSTNTYDRTT